VVKRGLVDASDDGAVNESVASRYGFSIDSGDDDVGSRRGIDRYTSHLPLGVDMLPSPVIKTCTAIALEPASSDEGGNIRTAVSTSWFFEPSPVESLALVLLVDEYDFVMKEIGLSMMAMHLATEECA